MGGYFLVLENLWGFELVCCEKFVVWILFFVYKMFEFDWFCNVCVL